MSDVKTYTLDPLADPRWSELVRTDERATLGHTVEWLRALHATYAYVPVVYTTCPPGEALSDALLLCRVSSWLTGRRLVSLPFTDHCDPIVSDGARRRDIIATLQRAVAEDAVEYVELRPRHEDDSDYHGFRVHARYHFHELDLRPPAPELLRGTHKTAVQQAIRRAEREQLRYEEGRNHIHLSEFYRLLLRTRRRHHRPPQPIEWFRNLAEGMGDRLKIRLAMKDGAAVASILTLQWGQRMFYKYGASDERSHHLGGMQFLIWNAIVDAKQQGLATLDFGRSEMDNTGLVTFKARWGAVGSSLAYWRCSNGSTSRRANGHTSRLLQQVVSSMPDAVLAAAGRLLYRHVG